MTCTAVFRTAHALVPALAASLVVLTATLTGCGREELVVGLELELLVEQQANFEGRLVRTRGVVRGHPDPRHYWLEDAALNRVGLAPAAAVSDYVGEEVEVVGRFSFARDRGRRIEVQSVSR
ncbi:MAG: hypothetical protein JJT93_04625 [Gammaproteobacteria bacterium]|nr:hypothetical protein [Gammaproteobacteria bacterium]TVQ48695.1 MAG: hypothetical protein EA371_05100 [Gammaproteobacteria bacterium]